MDSNWFTILETLVKTKAFPTTVHRILLWGKEPGTGKSSWGHYQFGLERVERIVMHEEVLPDDLLYSIELVATNGATETIRRDGPILRSMKEGNILVIDEIVHRSPPMESLLHAVLDDRSIAGITLSDGTRIVPKEGFGVIATTNAEPSSLGPALLDRFDVILQVTTPHPGALASIQDKSVRAAVTNHYGRVARAEWRAAPSMRRAMSYDKLSRVKGLEKELAAICNFGDAWQEILNAISVAGSKQ